jgi:YidC/Oxa1 family membrane protein insertase
MEQQRQEALLKQQQQQQQAQTQPGPAQQPNPAATREAVIGSSPRIAINTPRLGGSIDLKGGRIDDLTLTQYRETIDPASPPIVLFSPSGAPGAYYAEFGWVVPASGSNAAMPGPNTVWTQHGSGTLGVGHPVTLTYDNGQGLVFTRTISVDDRYLFTVRDEVANKGDSAVTLFPYALISRHGTPQVQGYYILHEGLIGMMGDQGLQEETYKKMGDKKSVSWDVTNAWLGITDKYWAAALLPDTSAKVRARFSAGETGGLRTYQTDYLAQPLTIAPGTTGTADARLFAGAKEVSVVGINFPFGPSGYNEALHLNHFDLLIDWGWFYFLAKPSSCARLFLPALRQFRHSDPISRGADKTIVRPVRQPLLPRDERNEAAPTADRCHSPAISGRQGAREQRDHRAVQARKRHRAFRLPANPNPIDCVLPAVQTAERYHRNAPSTVL